MRIVKLLLFILAAAASARAQSAISMTYTVPPGFGESVATYWKVDSVAVDFPCGYIGFTFKGWKDKAAYDAGDGPVPGAEHSYNTRRNATSACNLVPTLGQDNLTPANYADISATQVGQLLAKFAAIVILVQDLPQPDGTFVSFFANGTVVP